jgi:hypothetical protein
MKKSGMLVDWLMGVWCNFLSSIVIFLEYLKLFQGTGRERF